MKAVVSSLTLAAVMAVTGCGGGSGVDYTAIQAMASPTASVTVPVTGIAGSPQLVTLAPAGGFSGTMTFTPVTTVVGATAVVSTGTAPPAGAPAPGNGDQALLFVGLRVSSTIALTGLPAFVFTMPDLSLQSIRRSPQSGNLELFLDFFDPSNPSAGYQSGATCSLSGNTVSCTAGSELFTLLAQLQYVFELTSAAPAGGAAVISVPTAAPIVCSPSSDIVGVKQTNVIDCTAQGYSGTFAISVADPTVASVQQSDAATYTFFSVTGLRAGSTTLSLQSNPGGTGSVAITVAQ